jgi:hypothetical protein
LLFPSLRKPPTIKIFPNIRFGKTANLKTGMYLKLIIFCMLNFPGGFVKSQPTEKSILSGQPDLPKDSTLIAFASDTQAPMWVETLWLKANNNRQATRDIFSDIASRRPGSLFLLGDVVNLGYSNRQWKPIDNYLSELRSRKIDVYAILGNHEVMGFSKKGQAKFQARFPEHKRTGYLQVRDSVAIVLLNSNFNSLTPSEDSEQVNWYKSTLQQLDADSSIQYIITTCHHSPYTNSKIVGPSTAVQNRFVNPFLASKKSKLFLSGHCHGFEHYNIKGKDFMVIGGGGGLHQPLRQDGNCLPDLCKNYKPLFHYLTVRRSSEGLQVTSYELKKDFSNFDVGLQFDIQNPNKPSVQYAKTVVREPQLVD